MFSLEIDKNACSKCHGCVSICTNSKVLSIDDQGYPFYDNIHKCISCGHCIAICPNEAITVKNENDGISNMHATDTIICSHGNNDPDTIFQTLCSIRSTRKYLSKTIEEDKVKKIIDVMICSPSAGNEQNRSYHILTDTRKIRELETDVKKENEKTKKMLTNQIIRRTLITSLRKHCEQVYIENRRNLSEAEINKKVEETLLGLTAERDDFFIKGAPLVILVTSDTSKKGMHKDFYKSDAGIAITYATIMASSLGLSSCRLGLAEIMINRSKYLKSKYSISKKEKITGILALGYSDIRWHSIPPRGPSVVVYN